MKNWKRWIAALLALVLCVGMLPPMATHVHAEGLNSYSEGLEYALEGDHYVVTGLGACTDSHLMIPDTYNGLPVTAIADDAFSGRQQLVSVTLPGSITTIGQWAFSDCYSLMNVTLSEGLQTIGIYAFAWCEALTGISLPNTLREIDSSAFYECRQLTNVHIPANVELVGERAFSSCRMLQEITVSADNANYCAANGVLYNKDMTTLVQYPAGKVESFFEVPGGVTVIGGNAFEGANNLVEVGFPNSVISIEFQAFGACYNLQQVNLPSSLEQIGENAFWSCPSLTSITIPASVTMVQDQAFAYCTGLTNIVVEQGNKYYLSLGGVLYSAKLQELVAYPLGKVDTVYSVPAGVETVHSRAFAGSLNLQEVVLPNTVTRIVFAAFEDCQSLTSVTLPTSITYLGNILFRDSNNLQHIYYEGTIAQWEQIYKESNWNQQNWNGGTCDHLVRFLGECAANGHSWTNATCTTPKTCTMCAATEGEALGHAFEDDVCTRCGMYDYDGKVVQFYLPCYDVYMTASSSGSRLEAGNKLDAAAWLVSEDKDGYYSFSINGFYLTAGETGNSLYLSDMQSDWTRWEMTPVDGGFYLRNIGAYYNGKPQYLEYYKGFTTYGFNENSPELYTFQFVVLEGCAAYGHSWSAATCQQERYCTVCGVYGGYGDHNYVDGMCMVCGLYYSLGLEYRLEGDHYVVAGIGSFDGQDLVIPSTYNGLPVTAIADDAFRNCNQLVSVTLPSSITTIGRYAFSHCYSLMNVTLSEGLQTIGTYAFAWCHEITNVNLPGTLTEIDAGAFCGCSQLEYVYIPANVALIEAQTFGACQMLQGIIVSADNAYYCAVNGVLYTKDMTILVQYPAGKTEAVFAVPSGVTSIGELAFMECYNLQQVVLPEGLTNIAYNAFTGCSNLRYVNFPSTLEQIQGSAFWYCSSLTSVTIPASVVFVGNQAFAHCSGLKEILVEKGNKNYISVNGVLYSADMQNLVAYPGSKADLVYNVPKGVAYVQASAFAGNMNLQHVVLPNTVQELTYGVFESCQNLISVTLPSSLTYLYNDLFRNCNNLQHIYYEGTVAQWNQIKKSNYWNQLDYDGGTCDHLVRYLGECAANGHVWVEATCTAPKTCTMCAATEGEALGHAFKDDVCTRCGVFNYNGKVVLIYNPYTDQYMTANPNSYGFAAGTRADAATWTVTVDENGYFIFSFNGQYLTAVQDAYDLYLFDELTDCGRWQWIAVDGGHNLVNVGATFGGSASYLINRNRFRTYRYYEKYQDEYLMQLVVVEGCEAYGHSWSDANCQQEKYCTVCGVYGGYGDHTYVDGMCKVCGLYCSQGLEYRQEGDHYVVTGIGSCADAYLVIPSTYNGLPVTEIATDAFYNCNQLVSVTLPGSITTIDDWAFYYCNSLVSVTFAEGLQTIGTYAFAWCDQLSSVVLPSTVQNIGYAAFGGCSNLPSITVHADNAYYCAVDGVLYTKDMTTLVQYPAGKLDNYFEIPYGVKTVGVYAFEGSYNLVNIIIPESVTQIDSCGFHNCVNLVTITIPAGVTYIGNGTFENCNSLTEIVVNMANKNYCSQDGVLYNRKMTELICYPPAKSDTSFTIPGGVVTIGDSAFRGADFAVLVIPEGVSTIGRNAFTFCYNLTTVFMPTTITSIEREIFMSCNQLADIYYAGTEEQWNAISKAENWDRVDWEGNRGTFKIHFNVDCSRDGHTWREATCTEPKTCIYCGVTEGEPYGHKFENGVCLNCGCADHGAVIAAGDCGANITWTLYEDGLLQFVGSGDMYEYSMEEPQIPWHQYAYLIQEIDISEGITSIAHYAFADCSQLTTVELPAGMYSIGVRAFSNCTNLRSVVVYGMRSGYTGSGSSFNNCPNLTDLYICDEYFTGKDPYYFLGNIGLRENLQRVYMIASTGGLSNVFAQEFSCTILPEAVRVDGVDYILYTLGDHNIECVEHGEPTCTEDGYDTYFCTKCGWEYQENIAATGHSWDSDYVCTVCRYAPEYVTDLGFTLDDIVLGDDGKYYTAEGHLVVIALRVPLAFLGGYSLENYVDAYGDALFNMSAWDSLISKVNEEGYVELTQRTYALYVILLENWVADWAEYGQYLGIKVVRGHIHKYTAVVTAPTCTENGYTTYTCECGDSYIGDVTPARHTWDSTLTKAPTTSAEGTLAASCALCGATANVTLPALNYVDYTYQVLMDATATADGCGWYIWNVREYGFVSFYEIIRHSVADRDAKVVIESAATRAGNTIRLEVRLENNPGLWGLKLRLEYETETLTLVRVENGDLLSDLDWSKEFARLMWTDDEETTENGVLCVLEFQVAEDAVVGDSPVVMVLEQAINGDFGNVKLHMVAGNVSVINVVYGDVNDDGVIDLIDVLMLRKYLVNIDPITGESSIVVGAGADVNADGAVDLIDVLMLRKYLVNIDPITGESSIVLGPQ